MDSLFDRILFEKVFVVFCQSEMPQKITGPPATGLIAIKAEDLSIKLTMALAIEQKSLHDL